MFLKMQHILFLMYSDLVYLFFFQCVFYNNRKSFNEYINYFFNGTKAEKQPFPKLFVKYLLQIYRNEKDLTSIHYKLLFHAFSTAYENDFDLVYKFFTLIVQIIGFDLNEKMIFFKASKLKIASDDISLTKSQEILLAVLEVLKDSKIDLKCTLKDTTFSDFLKNLLIEFLYFNNPSINSYKIFIRILSIEPLLIQSLTEETVCYAMLVDNTNKCKEYNNLILSIFDTYARLHRIESLVSKMVEALNNGLHGHSSKINSLYVFNGVLDAPNCEKTVDLQVERILSKEILDSFSKSICQLASWQVINVFKTLLHFLNQVLANIDHILNGR